MNNLLIAAVWAAVFTGIGFAGSAVAEDAQGENAMEMQQVASGSGEHPIGWFMLAYTDQAKTQEFYSNIFGWTFEPFTKDMFFFMTPRGLGGGFSGKAEEEVNATIYLYVSDIDATLAAVEQAGGEITMGKQVVHEESGGAIAFFKDPAGVLMGIADMEMPQDYEPEPLKGTDGLVPGSLVSVELYGADLEVTGKFYKSVFGWGTMSAMPQYMMFNTGKGISGVFQGHTPVMKVMPYVWVEDVAAALDQIDAADGKRLGDPMSMPGMPTFGYFTDPAGKSIGLMGPAV